MLLSPWFLILFHPSFGYSFNSPSPHIGYRYLSNMSLSVDAWKEVNDFQFDHLNSLTGDDFTDSWWKTDDQGLDVRLHSSPAAEPHRLRESQASPPPPPPHKFGGLSDPPPNGSPHLNLLWVLLLLHQVFHGYGNTLQRIWHNPWLLPMRKIARITSDLATPFCGIRSDPKA